MTNIGKKQMNEEIAALARLKDSDIDTSDAAEISDWSEAFVGKFYHSDRRTIRGAPSPDAEDWTSTPPSREINRQENRLVHLPASAAFSSSGSFNYFTMSSQELVAECVGGRGEAWQEFFHRYSRLITSVVIRMARQWGDTSPELINDLTQEVYLNLANDNCRLLKTFEPVHENAVVGYLKAITANVALGYFRAIHAAKRGSGGNIEDTVYLDAAPVDISSTREPEMMVMMEEIDQILKEKASERDLAIFRLHYHQGLTAKEIAAMPAVQLTVKGVESVLHRLIQVLRHELKVSRRKPDAI